MCIIAINHAEEKGNIACSNEVLNIEKVIMKTSPSVINAMTKVCIKGVGSQSLDNKIKEHQDVNPNSVKIVNHKIKSCSLQQVKKGRNKNYLKVVQNSCKKTKIKMEMMIKKVIKMPPNLQKWRYSQQCKK